MVRLGKSFARAVLAAGLVVVSRPVMAQMTAPQIPQASVARPANTTSPGQTSPSATAQPAKAHVQHRKAAAAAEATPTPPAPPPTLEQLPPTAPRVSFQNGELTIDAPNSTLAQVLRAVQARTGAAIEIPAGAANDRVVTQLGPGQPRDVLNTLLNGTKFDYVILGVMGDPGAVQRVILTPRQSGPAGTVNTAQNNNKPQATQDEDSAGDEGVPVADTAENDYQNPDQPPPPPGGFRRPMLPGGQTVDPGAAFGNGEQQFGPKTPEQLMQQMQQLQQQQQIYQQQLNPANQQPQP